MMGEGEKEREKERGKGGGDRREAGGEIVWYSKLRFH